MSENYTAEDFAKATFARHGDGGRAARFAGDKWPWMASTADAIPWLSDEEMARGGWVPVVEATEVMQHRQIDAEAHLDQIERRPLLMPRGRDCGEMTRIRPTSSIGSSPASRRKRGTRAGRPLSIRPPTTRGSTSGITRPTPTGRARAMNPREEAERLYPGDGGSLQAVIVRDNLRRAYLMGFEDGKKDESDE